VVTHPIDRTVDANSICGRARISASSSRTTSGSAPWGELQVNSVWSHMVGRHTVAWFVAGEKVGAFTFRIHA
jgi:hypothetical protein